MLYTIVKHQIKNVSACVYAKTKLDSEALRTSLSSRTPKPSHRATPSHDETRFKYKHHFNPHLKTKRKQLWQPQVVIKHFVAYFDRITTSCCSIYELPIRRGEGSHVLHSLCHTSQSTCWPQASMFTYKIRSAITSKSTACVNYYYATAVIHNQLPMQVLLPGIIQAD